MGMNSSSSSQNVWSGQEQYLTNIYQQSQGLQQYQYGQDRVQGFNSSQQQAMGLASDRALGGSALMRQASGVVGDTLSGKYLNPESNPYLKEYASQIGEQFHGAVNALGSRMESAGRTGSGAHASGMGAQQRNLSRGLSNLYGQAYESERGRMVGAVGQAAGIAENDYRDISALQSVGQMQQQQSQRFLDDRTARFQQGQSAESELLQRRSGLIGAPVITSKQQSSDWHII